MSKRYWLIRGYDGLETIFETWVDFGQFSADQIQDLLKPNSTHCAYSQPQGATLPLVC